MHKHESDAPDALPSIVVTLPGPEVPYFPILRTRCRSCAHRKSAPCP